MAADDAPHSPNGQNNGRILGRNLSRRLGLKALTTAAVIGACTQVCLEAFVYLLCMCVCMYVWGARDCGNTHESSQVSDRVCKDVAMCCGVIVVARHSLENGHTC